MSDNTVQTPAGCNTLFCILAKHDDERHTDVTGHTWVEPLSDRPVIARAYSWGGENGG